MTLKATHDLDEGETQIISSVIYVSEQMLIKALCTINRNLTAGFCRYKHFQTMLEWLAPVTTEIWAYGA